MKDWVMENDWRFSGVDEDIRNELKEINFNFAEEIPYGGVVEDLSDKLLETLRVSYKRYDSGGREITYENGETCVHMLCSVLGDLEKDDFDKLCNTKNLFICYAPPK